MHQVAGPPGRRETSPEASVSAAHLSARPTSGGGRTANCRKPVTIHCRPPDPLSRNPVLLLAFPETDAQNFETEGLKTSWPQDLMASRPHGLKTCAPDLEASRLELEDSRPGQEPEA